MGALRLSASTMLSARTRNTLLLLCICALVGITSGAPSKASADALVQESSDAPGDDPNTMNKYEHRDELLNLGSKQEESTEDSTLVQEQAQSYSSGNPAPPPGPSCPTGKTIYRHHGQKHGWKTRETIQACENHCDPCGATHYWRDKSNMVCDCNSAATVGLTLVSGITMLAVLLKTWN